MMAVSVAILCFGQSLVAQRELRGAIVGRIVDSATALPVGHASVSVEGTERRTHTSSDGTFALQDVVAGVVHLRVARVGWTARVTEFDVRAGQTTAASVALIATDPRSDAVVVTGYATQSRTSLTTPIVSVRAADANGGAISTATQLLVARVPGVQVTLNNGEPGANAQVRIRGSTSIGAGNDPLYVIDGVPLSNEESEPRGFGIGGSPALGRNPLNAINPADIASVTVLKDAAASAIYGSRGANGVVLIETKRARAGALSLEYGSQFAVGQVARQLDLVTGAQYRTFVTEQVAAGKLPATRITSLGTANTDWQKETQRPALVQTHDIALAGGTKTTAFRASLNFADQPGVVIANGFRRVQGRVSGTHDALSGRLRLGLNLSAARLTNDYLPYENSSGFEGGVFQNVTAFNPTRPVYATTSASGTRTFYELGPGRQSLRNPVALAKQVLDDGTTTQSVGNVMASYMIAPSLVAQVNVGEAWSDGRRNTYLPRASTVGAEYGGLAQRSKRTLESRVLNALLTWSPNVGSSVDVDVLGGFEYTDLKNKSRTGESRNFPSDAAGYNDLSAGASPQSPTVFELRSDLTSVFSRASVAFGHRYFLAGTLRGDRSSLFTAGNAWAAAPAISASWLISGERFAHGLPLSRLALRAGYGSRGNQALQLDPSLLSRIFGVVPPAPVTWERSTETNIGLDVATRSSRVSGSVDVYSRKSTNLLLYVPPFDFGGNVPYSPLQNIGAMRSTGVEIAADAHFGGSSASGLTLTSGLVVTVERTRVLEIGPVQFIQTAGVSGQGQFGVYSQLITRGRPLGTFVGYQFAGFTAAGNQQFAHYDVTRDASGNETSRTRNGTTTTPGFNDRLVIGDANPDFSVGLRSSATWKHFDASWLWRWEQGRDVFNNTALVAGSKSNVVQDKNFLASALKTPESLNEFAIYSSRWIEDGSFLRLQNVTVGYTFTLPGSARTARAYVSGDNLLLFTPYSGYDPEVFIDAGFASRGVDYMAYPRARTVAAGFRLQF